MILSFRCAYVYECRDVLVVEWQWAAYSEREGRVWGLSGVFPTFSPHTKGHICVFLSPSSILLFEITWTSLYLTVKGHSFMPPSLLLSISTSEYLSLFIMKIEIMLCFYYNTVHILYFVAYKTCLSFNGSASDVRNRESYSPPHTQTYRTQGGFWRHLWKKKMGLISF